MTERISGEVTLQQPVTILGLTEAGADIEAPFALHNDSLHDFRLSLGARSVVVKGRVVRCEVGDLRGGVVYRCRVEFVDASPHVMTAIREFVA